MNNDQTTAVNDKNLTTAQSDLKTQTATKRKPYRSQLVNRGDVSHGRNPDEVRDIVTDDTTEAADMHEIAAMETILKGEAPADRIRLLRLLLRQERLNYAAISSRDDNPDDILVKDWRTLVGEPLRPIQAGFSPSFRSSKPSTLTSRS